MVTTVRAPNEPTMQEKGRENESPMNSQERGNVGTQDGQCGAEREPKSGF